MDEHRAPLQPWLAIFWQIPQSVIISRDGLILTLSILPCPQGRIFWSTPCRKIDAERLSVLHQNSGGIGKSIPSALQISLDPRDFPRASPSGNLSGLGKSFGRRGWISQYLPRLGGARIQSITSQSRRCSTIRWRRNIKSFGSKFVGIWPWPQAGPLPGLVISYITTRNQWLTPKATCQYLTVAFLTSLISVEN